MAADSTGPRPLYRFRTHPWKLRRGSSQSPPPMCRSTAFTEEQYAQPAPDGCQDNFWHQARNRIVWSKLTTVLGRNDKVLDIGCGRGVVVQFLRNMGVDCEGVDIGSPTPVSRGVAPHLRLGISAFDLPSAIREGCGAILLLDVLEHLPAPSNFLRESERWFPNIKSVLVTVPARMELWSNYDSYYGHCRRYSLHDIAGVAEGTNLRLESGGYFFHSLYAGALLLRLLGRDRSTRVPAPAVPMAHRAVGNLLAWEEAVTPSFVPGASLYALFRKGRDGA